jgi:hypothetical protein
MQRNSRRARQRAQAEALPLDIVPLTLAVWLGAMTAVACLVRVAEQNPVNPAPQVAYDAPMANFQ